MSLFRRLFPREAASALRDDAPVIAFWDWWHEGAQERITASVTGGMDAALLDEMHARVDAIHPGLRWETAKGQTAAHALIVSAGGAPELRRIAERWRHASPPDDALWQFHTARQRDESLSSTILTFRLLEVDMSAFVAVPTENGPRQRVDLTLHHPVFGRLSPDERAQLGFLYLDALLGEDDVERWIGQVDFVVRPIEGGVSGDTIIAAVDSLAQRPDDGMLRIGRGETSSGIAVVVSVRSRLHWLDRPTLDLHTELRLPFVGDENGLPTPGELQRLYALEDELSDAVGARGEYYAQETTAGTRTLHWYTDSLDQNGRDSLDRFAKVHKLKVSHVADPGWQAMQRFG